MKALIILVLSIVVIMVTANFCDRYFQRKQKVAPLVACQSVPANLSEDQRRCYSQICSATTVEGRFQSIGHLPIYQPAVMVALLPLLSDLMATDDYYSPDGRLLGRRRLYVCRSAAEVMAFSGADAVPFIIKALQSKKPVEVQAGLLCAREVVDHMEWKLHSSESPPLPHGVGEKVTNDLRALCSSLLPYVTMCTTNTMPEERWETIMLNGRIASGASNVLTKLEHFLPPVSSKE